MKLPLRQPADRQNTTGSTFIIVLWIAFGLVSLTLYFANSMSFELRASDNSVSGLQAEQTIEGAARYISYVLANVETNGVMPDPSSYLAEQVSVGDGRFWIIGRITNNPAGPNQVSFGLVDEASKLNLNTASSNMLIYLPRITADLTEAILDWRNTNGGSGAFQTYYAMSGTPYQNKSAPFETIDELRLLYGADMDVLLGEDMNRNGVLDPDEFDQNRNGAADEGVLEYVTVYSREPNTYSNGTPRVNIRSVSGTTGPLPSLLQSTYSAGRADQIMTQLQLTSPTGARGAGRGFPQTQSFNSPLDFYMRSGMTVDEFAQISKALTVTTGAYIQGRVNVNTASAAVLSCLPGLSDNPDLAQTLINYRESNPDKLSSPGWIVEALGQNNRSVLAALAARDCITTETYQLSADIAALGPNGRGYRRVRFIFDTCDGTPRIVFRQDLTHLGWALGKDVRQRWLAGNTAS
jgi:DNA uptake protein ComE-like DNA-binding protein